MGRLQSLRLSVIQPLQQHTGRPTATESRKRAALVTTAENSTKAIQQLGEGRTKKPQQCSYCGRNAPNCSKENSALASQPTGSQFPPQAPLIMSASLHLLQLCPCSHRPPQMLPASIWTCRLSRSSLRVPQALPATATWSLYQRSRPLRCPCATVRFGLLSTSRGW